MIKLPEIVMSLYITKYFLLFRKKKKLRQLFAERFVANEYNRKLLLSPSLTTCSGGFVSANPENDTARINGGRGDSLQENMI